MGFPAQTVDGAEVYIVSKTNDGGEIDTFTDADGREYTRQQGGGSQLRLVPVAVAEESVIEKVVEAVEEVVEEVIEEVFEAADAIADAATEVEVEADDE